MKFGLFAAGAVAAAIFASQASAQGVITSANGQYKVGIAANGELYDATSGVGYLRVGDDYDALRGGTPRDTWGLASTQGSAYADGSLFDVQGLSSVAAIGANSATVTSITNGQFQVAQDYTFVGDGNVLRVDVEITNLSAFTQHALFARNIDWDLGVDDTPDENTVGPFGANPFVIDSSWLGFELADVNTPYSFSCLASCNASGDTGAAIKLDLGLFGAGSSSRFTYYYGVNALGTSLNDLVAQGQAAGATYILGTQSLENGAYPDLGAKSAILGVSDVVHTGAVPEPATWGMMILGFFGLGSMVRRRRAFAA